MGRQINFFIEEDSYQQLVEKAISMGFVILREEPIGKPGAWDAKCDWHEKVPDFSLEERHYFYNQSLGNFLNVDYENKLLDWDGSEAKMVREVTDHRSKL